MDEEPVGDHELVSEIFRRVTGDLAMIVDKPFETQEPTFERMNARPAGKGRIHVSFKLDIQHTEGTSEGCLLLPLPSAVVLAGNLNMQEPERIEEARDRDTLDDELKDAILELSNFAANAAEAAFKNVGVTQVEVRSSGCQGVRPDVRPALLYEEGEELLVGRVQGELEGVGEAFEMLLVLPALVVPTPALA